ncbi:hypothetical protein EON80_22300 [bacterium]|nr:MAG: hypothetical protein EON80_22300 [bacterium]
MLLHKNPPTSLPIRMLSNRSILHAFLMPALEESWPDLRPEPEVTSFNDSLSARAFRLNCQKIDLISVSTTLPDLSYFEGVSFVLRAFPITRNLVIQKGAVRPEEAALQAHAEKQ